MKIGKKLVNLNTIENWEKISQSYHEYWNNNGRSLDDLDQDWIGAPLKFLECNSTELKSCVTFLYNDANNNIELLITMAYPWFFPLNKPPMSYEKWLQSYKVLYRFILSYGMLDRWIILLRGLSIQLRNNVDATAD